MGYERFIGAKFGRWTVIGVGGRTNDRRQRLVCRCECGNEKEVKVGNLRSGQSKSCGCIAVEGLVSRSTLHGHSIGGKPSLTFSTWRSMLSRCNCQNHTHYRLYGGRGVKVCYRWLTFENFLSDMGLRPSSMHTLDRYPNKDGDYTPDNCRWATKMEQNRNQSINRWITHPDGRRMIAADWAKLIGITKSGLNYRLNVKRETIDQIISHFQKKGRSIY